MDKEPKFKAENRIWLNNDPSMTSCLNWHVIETEYGNGCSTDAEFNVRDCCEQITLEFGFGMFNIYSKEERLQKVGLVIDELKKFRSALLKAGVEDE